jgi:ABC-type nitrate/sulfonate/bicarbonate transport system substrate-binding protein
MAKKIIFGTTNNLSWTALLAKEKRFFSQRGLDIDFRSFISGKKCLAALQKGWIDVANIIDVNVAELAFIKKPKIKVLYITQIKRDDGIVAHKKSGVINPADLKDKKIGYLPKTSSHLFLVKFFEKHNILLDEKNLISMTPDIMRKEFFGGCIDAFSIWEPINVQMRFLAAQNDTDIVYFHNASISSFHVVLAASSKILKKDNVAVDSIVEALRDAERFAVSHPDETREILSKNLNISPNILMHIYDKISLQITEINQDFWQNVQMHVRWINPDKNIQYEKFVDSLVRF